MKKEKNQPEPLEYGSLMEPLFYGTGEMLTWDAIALIDSIDRKHLYSSLWHDGKNNTGKSPRIDEADFDDLFSLLNQEIVADSLIDARGFYGFFPVISDDDTLILLSPDDFHTEIASFSFPRLEEKKWRSFADYFRPEGDIFSISIATIGLEFSKKCNNYYNSKNIKGLYLNEIGFYLIEILVKKLNNEMKKALFLQKNQGLSSIFGKPGMPDLQKQQIVLDLICAEDRLGVTLSKDFKLQPEHSYLGVYSHHTEAKDFSAS